MNVIVPRTCTEISAGNEDQHREKESRPLKEFRDVPAYVLLGDPGAGKTTAFEAECEALGETAYSHVITVDEFLTYDVRDLPPEWREKTLFIDGLDEVRAGAQGESAFREIRKLLRALGKPRFRLSCRQADWLGTNDQERLESVSLDSKVTVLRLDPLTVSDVEKFLKDRSDIPDAHTFIEIAKEKGVDGLLTNPLSLDMLAEAVASGRGWPESRKETFEMACHKIVAEHHPVHKEAQASKGYPSSDQLLDAAGRLCAIQLISGVAGYTLHGQPDENYPALDQCDSDSLEMLRYALATKLFKSVSDNRFSPVHRHIAEFLGARHLARVIKSGLPARRVIALIEGKDGTVVTEMRGLSAWLAAHCEKARSDLIKRDPIGVGLYGDIREFSTDNKRALLKCLNREASRLDSAFLKTTAFGALATPDMESVLGEILKDSARDKDHQIFIGFILNVLSESSPLPNLSEILLEIVRDNTWWPGIDTLALDAFIKNCPDSQDKTNMLKALLADIQNGSVSSPNTQYFESLIAQQLESAALDPISRIVSEDLSLEAPQEHAQEDERITAIDIERLRPSWATPPKSLAKEQEKWLNRIRSNKTALRENRATLDLLYRIGFEYFGFFYDFNDDKGLKSIEKWLLGDHDLTNAALEGLRGAINREEVPDAEKILGLKEKGRTHYLGLPFLAGLAEVERTTPEDSSEWDDDQIRTALAFYYSTPHADYRPKWYQRLLVSRPEIVADVQRQFAICEFRRGNEHIYKLYELAYDPDHTQVAQYASLPLLRAFPTRCKLKQIQSLDYLLWAAIQHADRASLQEIIKKKLSSNSMNVAQRVHWLAASIIVSPGAHNDLLSYLRDRKGRIQHLAQFFFPDDQMRPSLPELRVEVLELLIRLVGSYVGSDKWKEGGLVTLAQQASRLVNDLIQRLAASPTKDASQALAALLADPALSRWYDVLSRAQDAQRVTWRDASYRHFTIEQICQTLNDDTPANPGDLAALVMHRLRELADQIRHGSTDAWSQYWNEPHGQLPTQKNEDRCRKALLSDLQQRLPQGVDAQPEGQYANDKRADIRISYEDFQVPVEIKRNMNRDLWSAPRNQLIAQYTIDPDTDGYGIYLVFWFGEIDGCRTKPPPSGTRPANAEELKKRLEATLSPDEALKISVCVIDVSRPD
ncbi:MAG: hypothetical protein OXL41_02835 [Nitrospinae bacterium]|nr:hypothetical protein [Nitrospinota bacterium]